MIRLYQLREWWCLLRGGHRWMNSMDWEPIRYCERCTYWRFL